MSPKSRLYTLVKEWKNKPFHEVRDVCGESWLGMSAEALEDHQSWSKQQSIGHEPIFNQKGSKLTGSFYRPLLTATDADLLRQFIQGLDAISYWYRSGRFIPGILPIPTHILTSSSFVDALSNLILNSRLPVGLVILGIQSPPNLDLKISFEEGLLRLRRLGVLFHLTQFRGTNQELTWLEELQIEGAHINMSQIRNVMPTSGLIRQLKNTQIQIYAANLTLVKDLENAAELEVDHCYGGLMMSAISRHQTLNINDSQIANAIFSLHHHKNLNQNGDK